MLKTGDLVRRTTGPTIFRHAVDWGIVVEKQTSDWPYLGIWWHWYAVGSEQSWRANELARLVMTFAGPADGA